MNRNIKIGGHRGLCKNHAEENTIAAMEQALQAGMDYVEIDLQFTIDNEIVILHDDEVTIGKNKYSVVQLTYEELLKINENIPTLEKVLRSFKNKKLEFLLEIKPCTDKLGYRINDYMEKLFDVLIKYKEQICIFSIDYEFLKLFNEIDEDNIIKKGIIATEYKNDPIAFMEKHNVQLYLAYLSVLDKSLVSKLKEKGYLVSGSIVNTIEDKQKAQEFGVTMFETDFYDIIKNNKSEFSE